MHILYACLMYFHVSSSIFMHVLCSKMADRCPNLSLPGVADVLAAREEDELFIEDFFVAQTESEGSDIASSEVCCNTRGLFFYYFVNRRKRRRSIQVTIWLEINCITHRIVSRKKIVSRA